MTESKNFTRVFEIGLSYLSVPGPPLSPLTLGQLVDEAARKWTDSECLYDLPMDKRLTFDQLKIQVNLLASGLLKMGLSKGDRIGIWGPNSYRWIVTFLAAAKVGITIVPLNPGYEAPELVIALNHLSVKWIVLWGQVKTRNLYHILKNAIPDMKITMQRDGSSTIKSTVAPHLQQIVYMGKEQLNGTCLWTDVQKMGHEGEALEDMKKVADTVQFDDILYAPFTSGTTGRAKAAMVSHQAQVNMMFRMTNRLRLTQEDKECLLLPLFNLLGALVATFPLCTGSSVVIPSPTFSPSTAAKVVAQEKCTWLHGTPTMHFDLINSIPACDSVDLSSLKGAVTGGAYAANKLLVQMTEKYGISRVTITYGSTEANNLTFGRPDDPPELMYTTVGYPHDGIELKIVDTRGRIVPVGETGEICSRSFGNMQGYWEDPERTEEVIDSARWFHTGDAGYFLESGHLAVVGRFKDMLIRGGENIYPKEIEDFLYENLDIDEVHVFGVADERLGEVVAAWILPKSNEGVIMDTAYVKKVCAGKISRSKIPVYVKFVKSKDDFPRSSLGKAQKNIIRKKYENELGINTET